MTCLHGIPYMSDRQVAEQQVGMTLFNCFTVIAYPKIMALAAIG